MDINIKIISLLASIGVLILIWRQLRLQTKQAKFNTLTQIHQEVCTKEFRNALAIIFSVNSHELANTKSKEIIDLEYPISSIKDVETAVLAALNNFDF